jgi:hypothetical protein
VLKDNRAEPFTDIVTGLIPRINFRFIEKVLSKGRGLFLFSIKIAAHTFAMWRRLLLHRYQISTRSFSLEGEGWDEGEYKPSGLR